MNIVLTDGEVRRLHERTTLTRERALRDDQRRPVRRPFARQPDTLATVSWVLLGVSFLGLWAGSALLLSCLPWFERRETSSLTERLRPYVDHGWVNDVEDWLRRR